MSRKKDTHEQSEKNYSTFFIVCEILYIAVNMKKLSTPLNSTSKTLYKISFNFFENFMYGQNTECPNMQCFYLQNALFGKNAHYSYTS